MSRSPRLFDFHGDDPAYIDFLQEYIRVLESQLTGPTEYPIPPRHTNPYEACPSDGLRIVQYKPNLGRDNIFHRASPPQWEKELRTFLSALPTVKTWEDGRKKAGISDPVDNQRALRLMLGYADAPVLEPVKDDSSHPYMLDEEDPDLVLRGYDYAGFVLRCAKGLSFTESVVSFQSLIFVSYCVVMIRCGISKETTNHMMRRYIVCDNDDKTLEGYRSGIVWIHRCIAELLANGWGHKSWELFLLGMAPRFLQWAELTEYLLERKSLAQFARFANNDAQSYKQVTGHLGKATVPLQEKGWIPYCIPCIVHCLSGDIIRLERICDVLDYGSVAKSRIMALSKQFIPSIHDLTSQPIDPRVTIDFPLSWPVTYGMPTPPASLSQPESLHRARHGCPNEERNSSPAAEVGHHA
ncbi:hypothetical protein PENSTE_c023G07187 [Penicillium steckii]|uniref:Uncharacterized protein n=1 Tax=Penicillium steckii TaxID=303698 RepID=A0A1V6SRS4_9EURO|nr:hypothetical protein PENSTE_c023G07187 [Penicillium steckii]